MTASMTAPRTHDPPPSELPRGLTLTLTGRWENGGLLEVTYDEQRRETTLGPAVFGVAGALMHFPDRFLTSLELHRVLNSIYRASGNDQLAKPLDDKLMVSYVCRLRKKLNELLGDGWGLQIIETRKPLGYRITVGPDNLSVNILPAI